MAGCGITPVNGVLPNAVTKSFDPIQGLVDFTQDVKPYHTKIVEILVEYIHADEINVTIDESLQWVIEILFPGEACRYWFDTTTNKLYRRVNYTTRDFDILAVQLGSPGNFLRISGNYGVLFPIGSSFFLEGSMGDDGTYLVTKTEYNNVSNTTNIYVQETLTSTVASGTIRQITPSIYAEWLEIPVIVSLGDPTLTSTVYAGDYWFVQDPAADVRLYVRNTDNTDWIALDVVISATDPQTVICGIEDIPCAEFGYDEFPFDGVLGAPLTLSVSSIDGVQNSFTVSGDQTTYFPHAQPFDVKFSTNNDGRFHVLVAQYNSATNRTTIFTHQDINLPGTNLGKIVVDDNVLPVITFTQSTQPTATAVGQLWWQVELAGSPQIPVIPTYGSPLGSPLTGSPKVVLGTNVYRWNGSAWVLYHPFSLGYDESNDCVIQNPPRNLRSVFAERLSFILVPFGVGSPAGSPVATPWGYQIVDVNLTYNTITVVGNAVADLTPGTNLEIVSSSGNNGVYEVLYGLSGSPNIQSPYFNGTNTVVRLSPALSTALPPFGFVEPAEEQGIHLRFYDAIGVSTVVEGVVEAAVTTGNTMLPGTLDGGAWDIGAFDESFDTVKELYGNDFPAE